jgi:hypothetical protein
VRSRSSLFSGLLDHIKNFGRNVWSMSVAHCFHVKQALRHPNPSPHALGAAPTSAPSIGCTHVKRVRGIQTIAHPEQLPIFGWTALRPQSPSHL